MALRVRGETVDEITGAVTAMRAKMLRVEGARRTPSTSSAPAATRRAPTTSRPARPSSSRAPACRSPSTATARSPRSSGAADVLGALGVKIDLPPDGDRALHPRGRHRLHVRAGASSGDEACRPDPRRARHPHHLQPARAALQSGRRQAPDGRRVLARNGSSRWRRCSKNLGSERAWVVHGSDGLDEITTVGPDARRRARERHGAHASRSRPRTSGLRAPSPRRCAAATPSTTPRRCATCSRASKAPSATSRCSTRRRR